MSTGDYEMIRQLEKKMDDLFPEAKFFPEVKWRPANSSDKPDQISCANCSAKVNVSYAFCPQCGGKMDWGYYATYKYGTGTYSSTSNIDHIKKEIKDLEIGATEEREVGRFTDFLNE